MSVKPFYTLKDFAELTGIEYKLLYRYFYVYGMPCTQMKRHGTILVNTARALAWLRDNAGRIDSNEKYPDRGDSFSENRRSKKRDGEKYSDKYTALQMGSMSIQDIDPDTARAAGVYIE